MEEGKVSIIIPCYNGVSTIAQAIRGVLNQTYRPVELILVNDGSTDDSENIITSMEKEIKGSGVEFHYCPQKNIGLGGAINTGLKKVTGEYLAWCDADDELISDSIEKRVKFLKDHPDYGSVSSNAIQFKSNGMKDKLLELATTDITTNSDCNQFLPMLMGRSLYCAGCHLVRISTFCESHGGMDIYPARHGQNWQMLLPVYYTSKHGFINEPLYKYRVDENSMSSQVVAMPLKEYYRRQREYVLIVRKTLEQVKSMPVSERKKYLTIFKKRVYEQNLDASCDRGNLFDQLRWEIAVKYSIIMCKNLRFD